MTGYIELTRESFVKREDKKKKYCFAVGTTKRIFFMYPDTQSEMESWMKVLAGVIDRLKNPNAGSSANTGASGGYSAPPVHQTPTQQPAVQQQPIAMDERSEEDLPPAGALR